MNQSVLMECHKGFELLLRWLFPDQDDGYPQLKGRNFNETRLHFTVSVISHVDSC